MSIIDLLDQKTAKFKDKYKQLLLTQVKKEVEEVELQDKMPPR